MVWLLLEFNHCNNYFVLLQFQVEGLTDKIYTYRESLDITRRVASGLHRRGLKKGDVFAIYSPNCPQWLFTTYGVLANGACVTTLNPAYTLCKAYHKQTYMYVTLLTLSSCV